MQRIYLGCNGHWHSRSSYEDSIQGCIHPVYARWIWKDKEIYVCKEHSVVIDEHIDDKEYLKQEFNWRTIQTFYSYLDIFSDE